VQVEVDTMLAEYKGRYQLLFEKFAPSPQAGAGAGAGGVDSVGPKKLTLAEKNALLKASFQDMNTEIDGLFDEGDGDGEGAEGGTRERSGSFVAMSDEDEDDDGADDAILASMEQAKEETVQVEGHGATQGEELARQGLEKRRTEQQEQEEEIRDDSFDEGNETPDEDTPDEEEVDPDDAVEISDLELSEMQQKLLIGRLSGKRVLTMLSELTATRMKHVEMQAEVERLQLRENEMKDNLDLLRVSLEGSGVNKELQNLIATLTNQLRDKEEALQMLIADKAILAARIKELEEVDTK
jgi:hypothetical protein